MGFVDNEKHIEYHQIYPMMFDLTENCHLDGKRDESQWSKMLLSGIILRWDYLNKLDIYDQQVAAFCQHMLLNCVDFWIYHGFWDRKSVV